MEPGQTVSAPLVFPREVPRPGVYPVVLLLDYAPRAAEGATPTAVSQRAFLLLTLGATAAAPVRLSAPEVTLRDRAPLAVSLESADGRAHRVRLRVLTPRGLNPERIEDEVQVPATGVATVSVPLLRGAVPRPSQQGVLVVAETLDGEIAAGQHADHHRRRRRGAARPDAALARSVPGGRGPAARRGRGAGVAPPASDAGRPPSPRPSRRGRQIVVGTLREVAYRPCAKPTPMTMATSSVPTFMSHRLTCEPATIPHSIGPER